MTLQTWVLDATQCNTISELGEFLDVKSVDYSVPWPHGHRPSRLLISQAVAEEIKGHMESRYTKAIRPIRFRLIPCEVKE